MLHKVAIVLRESAQGAEVLIDGKPVAARRVQVDCGLGHATTVRLELLPRSVEVISDCAIVDKAYHSRP